MAKKSGTQLIAHPREEVFFEGTHAKHWRANADVTDKIVVEPQTEVIQLNSIIGVTYSLDFPIAKLAQGEFEAVVTTCVENEEVIVEGKVPRLGDFVLNFALLEGEEPETTLATFHTEMRFGRLVRAACNPVAQDALNKFMDPYAAAMAESIGHGIMSRMRIAA